jgi:hypothetical protein
MSRRLSSSLRVPSREGIRWRTSQAAEAIAFAYREARETLRTMLPGRRTGGRRNGHEISAVVVGRNDGYIPDFLECLSGTVRLNAIRGCLREVIFVEWAPPTDAPLLAPELCDRFPFLRSFVVPEEIQRAKWNSTGDGFLEYHAKNVGIRRATSPWVIVTNADILFGGDTSRFLRRLKSHPIRVGIAKRYDVSWRVGESRLAGRVRYHRAILSGGERAATTRGSRSCGRAATAEVSPS